MRRKEMVTVDVVAQEVHVDGEVKYRGLVELWIDGVSVDTIESDPRDTEDEAFDDAMEAFNVNDEDSCITDKFREAFGG